MKNWWVYVLRLEEGKYYVGITSQTPEIRMQEHLQHIRGANWTRKYPPTEIIYQENLGVITKAEAEAVENIAVRKYIKKYSLNNVRGGDITVTNELVKKFGYYIDRYEYQAFIGFLILIFLIIFMGWKLQVNGLLYVMPK